MVSGLQLLLVVFSLLLATAVSVVPQTLSSKTPASLTAEHKPAQRHSAPTVVAVSASGSTDELVSLVRSEQAQAGTESQQITAEVGHEGWPRVPRWNAWRATTTPKDPTPAVDCVWAEWQWWGKCNQTCGGGTKWRQRKIKTDARGDGSECTGHSKESKKCNTDACAPGVQHAAVSAAPRKAGVGPAAIPAAAAVPVAAPAQKKFYQKKSTMFMVAALLLMIGGGGTYKYMQDQEKELALAQRQGHAGGSWEGEGSDQGYSGGGRGGGAPTKKEPRKSIWNFSRSFSQRLDKGPHARGLRFEGD